MNPSNPSPSTLAWCFSTLGCPELSLPEVTALARQFQIGQVELRTVSERLDLPALFTEEHGTPENLKQWLTREGITVAALDSSAKLIGCTPTARQELLDFARWADALGIPHIRVFDGGSFSPTLLPEDRQEAADFLAWWEDEKSAHGWSVELAVETHDALCTAANCLDLAAASAHPLHILWDAHHTWRKGGEDPLVTWAAIRPLVCHVHFKDSIGEPSARHPFTYTPLGDGEFALEALLDQLRADGFTGPVSLEWERKWHPYLAPLAEALEGLNTFRSTGVPTTN